MQDSKKLIVELVKIKLTDNQIEALESFINDRGAAIFKNSGLLKAINRNDFESAILEFKKWTVNSGKQDPNLAELREKEIALFTK